MSGYHEDGQGRLSGILQALPLTHGFLAPNHYSVGIVDEAVADVICHQRFGQLFRPARNVKPEAEDCGVCLYRNSTISNKSQASVSFRGHRSHSTMMRRAYFLYWAMSLRMVQLPLAIRNSTSRSGSRIYFTAKNRRATAMPKAQARYVLPLPVTLSRMIL